MTHEGRGSEPRFDAIDLQILTILYGDARLSVRAIARKIGMSPGAVTERVQRLERAGVIEGYFTRLNPAGLGYRMSVLIGFSLDHNAHLEDAVQALLAVPEVGSVNVVSGQWDICIVAYVRDETHLRDLVLGTLRRIPGFRNSDTMLILEHHERVSELLGAISKSITTQSDDEPAARSNDF